MMRTLFLVLSFLSDSQTMAEIMRQGFILGVVNAGALLSLATWHAARRLISSHPESVDRAL